MAEKGSLEDARAVKAKVQKRLADAPEVNGIGLTRVGDRYAIKVNLSRETAEPLVPDEIDGVPIVCAVVGAVRKLKR